MISRDEGIELLKEYTGKSQVDDITTGELKEISVHRDTAVRDKVALIRKSGRLNSHSEKEVIFAIWLEATRILARREKYRTGPLAERAPAEEITTRPTLARLPSM